MQEPYKLKRIPMSGDPAWTYSDEKAWILERFNQYLVEDCTVCQSVNGYYYHKIDNVMNENGMNKFVAMIVGMLFMIEHNDVEKAQAYGTNLDIKDFETGAYDDLFTSRDLELIKIDVKKIKEYLSVHPDLLEE